MDFGLVPPEIQSTLMYAGPGPGPILATAAAWDGLAAELEAAATAYASQIDDLTSSPWLGGASEAMAASVAPYVAWIDMTAAQASETAAQVRAGVAAYETAFAATVPPTVVAHNRAELTALIATNIFGQNSAAIATNQAVYGEMWAQDAAAMYGYASEASGATRLTAVSPPPTVADGLAETAAVVQAVEGGQDALAQGAQAVPTMLEQLSLPAQAGVADVVVDDVVGEVVTGTAISGLGMGSAYHGALSSVNLFQRLSTDFVRQFSTSNAPTTTDIMERVNRIGLATGAILPDELDEAGGGHLGLGGFGDWHNWEQWLRQFGSRIGNAFLSAQSGQAGSVGALSVPQSWLAVPPDVQLAALEVSAHAAPEAADGASAGPAGLVAGGVASSMIGRALGAAAGARESADGRNRIVASAEPQRAETTVSELRERAELLREFSELRDSGALSEAEFAEQKRLVMRAADQPRVR